MSGRPTIADPSASEAWFHSWPQDSEERAIVRVQPEPAAIDEFTSEHPRPAESAADRVSPSPRTERSRDEGAFRIVTAIAVVEAAILIVAGISLSGMFGASTGTIVVDSVPTAAEVRIDGALAGVTPLSLTTEAGRRVVEVRQQQHARTIAVNVVRGETTHSLVEFVAPPPLAPASSGFHITSEPAAAQVSIDGVVRGETPLVVTGLRPGSHAISLRSDNGQVSRSIELAAGTPQSLHVLLPASPVDPGWVTVGGPTALRVFNDGRLVGATGGGRIVLSPGPHALEFVNEELALHLRQRVMVRPGRVTTVTPALPQGSLAIAAQPWAEVWVNDERAGETPLGNLSLPVGTYDVLLRHPEFGERKTRVRVTADTPARVSVDMGQRPEGQ